MYMDWFRIIVLTVAAIVLILLLVFIGILLSKGNTNQTWPPSFNSCPNYWLVSDDGKKCMVPGNLGSNSLNIGTIYGNLPGNLPGEGQPLTKKFTQYSKPNSYVPDPTGDYILLDKYNGICEKKCWANNFNLVWDGVSNYNSCSDATC
jgi:hypothetical protein